MKQSDKIRIILTPVVQSNRGDLEDIENSTFNSNNSLAKKIAIIVGESSGEILTISEFKKKCAFSKASNSFDLAVFNLRKRKQCYKLTDFMDDFNNQEFGGETEKFWMGYVKLK
ncbi:MAG: hypothetical protein KA007_00450 [Candidatus Pacebacteria bacterium]|nr:hypothetical protein [Candidatus Paceibacterota bacterium]